MSISVKSPPVIDIVFENGRKLGGEEEVLVLPATYDAYEGVVIDMEKVPPMDPEAFSSALRASMSLWKKQVSPLSGTLSLQLHPLCLPSMAEQIQERRKTENSTPVFIV